MKYPGQGKAPEADSLSTLGAVSSAVHLIGPPELQHHASDFMPGCGILLLN